MPTQIITTDDLREFKIELLEDIKNLLKTTSTTTSKKYLKSGELMKMLKVSPGTLQTLRINGTVPYTKIGGIIFYDAEEIEKVMKENSIHNKF
jgi:Mn-dependent DtxR family transcriptional regulator